MLHQQRDHFLCLHSWQYHNDLPLDTCFIWTQVTRNHLTEQVSLSHAIICPTANDSNDGKCIQWLHLDASFCGVWGCFCIDVNEGELWHLLAASTLAWCLPLPQAHPQDDYHSSSYASWHSHSRDAITIIQNAQTFYSMAASTAYGYWLWPY